MSDLDAAAIDRMTTPLWEQARAAVRGGDLDAAERLLDQCVSQWRSLQDYSINWITSLLSFVGRELGEEAVERALRVTGEEFVRPRRGGGWDDLPAAVRAKAIARAMVANFGTCEVEEDDEKIVLSFHCGTGGRLIDEGRYAGPVGGLEGEAGEGEAGEGGAGEGRDSEGYLVLRERSGRTFSRDALPVYCAHCSVNNEIQPLEWGSHPVTVEYPPERPGEPCVHRLYKDLSALPAEVYLRIGKEPPGDSPGDSQ